MTCKGIGSHKLATRKGTNQPALAMAKQDVLLYLPFAYKLGKQVESNKWIRPCLIFFREYFFQIFSQSDTLILHSITKYYQHFRSLEIIYDHWPQLYY